MELWPFSELMVVQGRPQWLRTLRRVMSSTLETEGMDSYTRFCMFMLSYAGRSLAMGRSPNQRVLLHMFKRFIVSETNSELERTRGPSFVEPEGSLPCSSRIRH
jgi:hypothetical protein